MSDIKVMDGKTLISVIKIDGKGCFLQKNYSRCSPIKNCWEFILMQQTALPPINTAYYCNFGAGQLTYLTENLNVNCSNEAKAVCFDYFGFKL